MHWKQRKGFDGRHISWLTAPWTNNCNISVYTKMCIYASLSVYIHTVVLCLFSFFFIDGSLRVDFVTGLPSVGKCGAISYDCVVTIVYHNERTITWCWEVQIKLNQAFAKAASKVESYSFREDVI